MAIDRKQLRGTILSEDRRTESFFRELLVHLGFDKRRLTFLTAPEGKGDACAWVRSQSQYPAEVKLLRQKRHQQLFLVAVCDGDRGGVTKRRTALTDALSEAGLNPRQQDEHIAAPVPTWSIETWLLAVLGDDTVDESESQKREFEKRYPEKERGRDLRRAAQAWRYRADQIPSVPSLKDGRIELTRIDFS